MEDCFNTCGESECIDPTLVDPLADCNIFNPSPVCGCDSTTYLNNCTATYENGIALHEDGACFGDCFDPLRIVPDIGCIEIFAPVCGCNDITYGNACEAWYTGGLAEWTEGPCETNGLLDYRIKRHAQVTPNPNQGVFLISGFEVTTSWQLFNSAGCLIRSGQGNEVKGHLPPGFFILRSEGFLPTRFLIY